MNWIVRNTHSLLILCITGFISLDIRFYPFPSMRIRSLISSTSGTRSAIACFVNRVSFIVEITWKISVIWVVPSIKWWYWITRQLPICSMQTMQWVHGCAGLHLSGLVFFYTYFSFQWILVLVSSSDWTHLGVLDRRNFVSWLGSLFSISNAEDKLSVRSCFW